MSLPPNRALPELFPTVFCSVHTVVASISVLPNASCSHGFPSVHPGLLTSVDASILLLPKLFPAFPFRPPYRRFHLTSAQRSSSQAIPQGFPSVHGVHASVSLLPDGALPKLFVMVSPPSTMSSLLPMRISPQAIFPRMPLRPHCRRFRLAPSQRSSPQAISHGFLSVHPVVASLSLPPRQSKLNE